MQRWGCADAFLDVTVKPDQAERTFDEFVRADGQRLRRVMSSQYGVDIGSESTDSALAWEHWDRLHAMSNPAGYLYRVAQTQARRAISRGRTLTFPPEPTGRPDSGSSIDGDLADALRQLPDQQRLAVLMVHVYGWTPIEVGRIIGTPAVLVRSHLRRGLRHLRTTLSKGTNHEPHHLHPRGPPRPLPADARRRHRRPDGAHSIGSPPRRLRPHRAQLAASRVRATSIEPFTFARRRLGSRADRRPRCRRRHTRHPPTAPATSAAPDTASVPDATMPADVVIDTTPATTIEGSGVTPACPPGTDTVGTGTLYLGGPASDQNLAAPGFIFSVPTGPTAVDVAIKAIALPVIGQECSITAAPTPDAGTVTVTVTPPAVPTPVRLEVNIDERDGIIGVTGITGSTSFETNRVGDQLSLTLIDGIPASATRIAVRFKKGDDVWELTADPTTGSNIPLAVPNGEADRFPDQSIDWVLFTAIDANEHVVDAGGGVI